MDHLSKLKLLPGLADKEPEDLTEDERFALALAAGCAMETVQTEDHRYVMRSKHPVGIQKINGKFRVVENRSVRA